MKEATMPKLRRSMLFVPGSNAAMLSTSFVYRPDSFMFDLEDSVSLREKDTARMLVFNALQHPMYKDCEIFVRVNPLGSEYGMQDLEAVVRGGATGVRTPKTDTADDVVQMDEAITKVEKACGREVGSTTILAAIESAEGVLNALAIAKASPRMVGIALGAEDYVRNLRTKRSPGGIELLFARCSILQAARTVGISAFDTVYSDANNDEGFLAEAELIKGLGFDGKSLINPRQIDLIHNVYAPSEAELAYAKKVIAAAEEAETRGLGVVSLNGKMVDMPIIERARLTCYMAERTGIKE